MMKKNLTKLLQLRIIQKICKDEHMKFMRVLKSAVWLFLLMAGQFVYGQNKPSSALSLYAPPKLDPSFSSLPQANPDAPKGGKMNVGVLGTFDSIFPFPFKGIPCLGNGITDEAMVYEKLMYRQAGEPMAYYAWLAESVTLDHEYKWIEFNLNKNARWADGNPVTAKDVEFTMHLLKEQSRPIFKNLLKIVERMEILNPRKIRIYVSPSPDPLNPERNIYSREQILILCGIPVLPRHILEGKKLEDLAQEKILGSGPYEIDSVQMGSSVTYKKRANYWGKNLPVSVGRYNFDIVKFTYFRDPNAMFEAMKAGQIDVMLEEDAKRRNRGYNFDKYRKKEVVLSELKASDTLPIKGFIFNTRHQYLANKLLRKALILAMDYDWINKNLFHGRYLRTTSFFGGGKFSAQKGALLDKEKAILQDLQVSSAIQKGKLPMTMIKNHQKRKARVLQLLQKAGYVIKNGRCVHVDSNKPLTISLIIENNDTQKEVIAYARQLQKDYGIQLDIRKLDTSQFWNRVLNFDFEVVSLKWMGMSSPGVEQRNRWTTESAERQGSLNWVGVKDKNIDKAITHLLSVKSFDDQVAASRVIDRLLQWGYYVIPLGVDQYHYYLHTDRIAYPEKYGKKIVLEKSFWWDKTAG